MKGVNYVVNIRGHFARRRHTLKMSVLYSVKSSKEMGMMYQLLLIHRSAVPKDPSENLKVCN